MTVKMIRTEDGKTGDIHPDEVEHMTAHGWEVVEQAQPKITASEMRKAIEEQTGTRPGPRTSHENLKTKYEALNG